MIVVIVLVTYFTAAESDVDVTDAESTTSKKRNTIIKLYF